MNYNTHSAKLLDCTIRDGGLVNDSNFADATVEAAYRACSEANIDFFEIGFKDDDQFFARDKFGKWRFCDERDICKIVSDAPRKIKISVLADIGKCDVKKFAPKQDSVVDIVRCAFYEPQKSDACKFANACADLGYETALCMMAVSTLEDSQIDCALDEFAASDASAIYLMDSFGALVPMRTRALAMKYSQAAHDAGKLFGAHFHNNLQCAFANTLEAVDCGADIVDCTLAGLGKGAGNCPTEMILQALNRREEKYVLRPILQAIEKFIEPLRREYRWGFDYPYMMTGLLNSHPRDAIAFEKAIADGEKKSIVDFYDEHFTK